jgi:phosphatidate phosphatase APP1
VKHWLLCALLLPAAVQADSNQVLLYDGWGSAQRFELEGRVVELKEQRPSKANDSGLRNLRRSAGTMQNSERGKVPLSVRVGEQHIRTESNEEGYFRVAATPATPLAAGWHSVVAQAGRAQGTGRLLIVPAANTEGIISDIDDTVIVSQVNDKKRLLKNTFLRNPLQRKTYPGTAAFYQGLLARNPQADAAPMFYLSASPRQLAGNIAAFLSRHSYPPGALITKQINGDQRDPLLDQQKYKLAKIETILSALPWVRFTLVGDDGEHDPEIYRAIQAQHPQQVAAIYIRKVNPDLKRAAYPGQLDLAMAIGK